MKRSSLGNDNDRVLSALDVIISHLEPTIEQAPTPVRVERKVTLYRDDSTSQVVIDRVKAWFWTAGNTVLTISRYDGAEGPSHSYTHWPRERFCWFKDEPK